MNPDFARFQPLPAIELPLPLTSAHSRRERENCPLVSAPTKALNHEAVFSADLTKSGDKSNAHRIFSQRRLLFPLPGGEGQGEGKAGQQSKGAQPLNASCP